MIAGEDARYDLGIEAAGDEASVAVLPAGEDEATAERLWHVETTLSRELLAAIDVLLTSAGVARDALASIAVDVGPGGYGGLRTSVATAQGLALALDIPLAGVGRLEVDAWPHLETTRGAGARAGARPVVAVHDAGRGHLAWAVYYGPPGAAPVALVEPRIDAPEVVAAEAPEAAVWCGEVTEALRAARAAAGRAGDLDTPARRRSAVEVVRLARLHAAYGDPALVDVVYLRPPPITRPGG